MSKKIHECYHVQVAFISHQGEEPLDILFNAEDDSSAIEAGVKWADNRLIAMKDLCDSCKEIAAIKIHRYQIGTPDENGYIKTGIFGLSGVVALFEWKCDHMSTIEEALEYAIKTVTP